MNTVAQFDAANQQSIQVEIDGPLFAQKIIGDGYFIIVNPDSKYVSFSKSRHDICFGDVTADVIKEYTNQQYANDYGDRLTGVGKTVKEYMQDNCRMQLA